MIYLAAYTFGSFLDEVFTKTVERRWKNFWYLCGWASAAVVAVIINPNGLAIYGISFVTVQVKVQQYIQEWLPPDYSEPLQLFFLFFLVITFISFVLSKKRADFRKLAVLLVFSYFGLTGRRNIALFAVIAIPILGYYLFSFLERIKILKKVTPVNRETNQPKFAKYINFAIVGMLGAIFIIKFYINGNPQIVQEIYRKLLSSRTNRSAVG